MKNLLVLLCSFFFVPLSVFAQGFSSGSTGADGALDLSTMSCPNNNCEVQLPESGVFNFTTVNVPQGKELRFKNNSRNTPVTILAQGQVTINGVINISSVYLWASGACGGTFQQLGPGGFRAGLPQGFGPGGGTVGQQNGKWIGPLSLVPIMGGSGAYNIGDGGGAIVIASSSSITLSGLIIANGSTYSSCGGPVGSGGAIRLVANSISCPGNLSATGGSGGNGVIRLEAPSGQLNFTGTSSPAAVLSTINPVVTSVNRPFLTITSIGGFAVPAYAGSRFDTVDLLLPSQLTDPVTVVVQATYIPVGTNVEVRPVRGSSSATNTLGTLSGTFEASTATATISNLDRTSVTYLLATATFDPPMTSQMFNPQGRDRVAKVRIESAIGAKPNFVFLRRNGTVINAASLPKAFLQQLGL